MEVDKSIYVTKLLPLFESFVYHAKTLDQFLEIESSIWTSGPKGYYIPFDIGSFTALLRELMARRDYKNLGDIDILDISWDSYRCSVDGNDNISQFCKSNNFKNHPIIRKERKINPILLDEYSIKVKGNLEQKVDDIVPPTTNQKKTFRLKKRFSFIYDGYFRIDMTIVKQVTSYQNFSKLNIKDVPEKFEVEVEYMGGIDDSSKACVSFFKAIANLIDISNGSWNHVPKTSRLKNVFSDYVSLTKRENVHERMLFLGPQPVTLECRHLYKPSPGIISILKDYTVTDKADGLRMLLYVAPDGFLYTIDSKLIVTSIGIQIDKKYANTLVDGEYITHTRYEFAKCMFMLFDIYYYCGEDVRKYPLMKEGSKSRLDFLDLFVPSIPESSSVLIKVKKFYGSDDILSDSKKIIISGNLHSGIKDDTIPYFIDGLIYTPRYLPVGGIYETDAPKEGTWPVAFKWKPPEFNSIDFYVDASSYEVILFDSELYRIVKLLVGSTGNSGIIDPLSSESFSQSNNYHLKTFVENVRVKLNSNNQMLCENGDMIEHSSIAEFRYDIPTQVWLPLRVRFDKLRPNFITIASSNWKSIQHPVTESIICGEEDVSEDKVLNEDDPYYIRMYSRDKSATRCMLNFHNHWVKDVCLLGEILKDSNITSIVSLFDIACGKGNDLPRWIKYRVRKLLGIDITEDNILNADDGVYARIRKSRNVSNVNYAFLTLDASKEIDYKAVDNIDNENLRVIGRSVWGIENDPRVSRLYDMASGKFKVITCNFAVHYFYDNETSLKNFCKNVANHIAKDGYFVGTCFDGVSVTKLLEKTSIGKDVTCHKGDRIIWSITRLYDNINVFGSKISVYIETIGNKNVEYIVDFDYLVNELSKYDIILHSTGTFDELYNKLVSEKITNKFLFGPDGAVNMTPEEKQLSFLNRWFIFKKKTMSKRNG